MSSTTPYRQPLSTGPGGANLADVLERVLDKGLVVAGDIRVNLLDIELLTIRVRLLLASADKAQELGMSWWRTDPFFTGREQEALDDGDLAEENRQLRDRLDRLEGRLSELTAGEQGDGRPSARSQAAARATDDG